MWFLNGDQHLCKIVYKNESCNVYLTDLKQVWHECLTYKEVQSRAKELHLQVDLDGSEKVESFLKLLLDNITGAKIDKQKDLCNIDFSVVMGFANIQLVYQFRVHVLDTCEARHELADLFSEVYIAAGAMAHRLKQLEHEISLKNYHIRKMAAANTENRSYIPGAFTQSYISAIQDKTPQEEPNTSDYFSEGVKALAMFWKKPEVSTVESEQKVDKSLARAKRKRQLDEMLSKYGESI